MPFKLPKDLATTRFPDVFTVELNDMDIDMVLPALFLLVRAEGRAMGPAAKGITVESIVSGLAANARIEGAKNVDPVFLDRWIRSSFVRMGRRGRARLSEQLLSVTPLHFVAYRAQLPTQRSRLRNAHTFVYHALVRTLRRVAADPEARLKERFMNALGRGVTLEAGLHLSYQTRDEEMDDAELLMEFAVMDQFPEAAAGYGKPGMPTAPVCTEAADVLAQDILVFLDAYGGKIGPRALVRYLAALVNFELFVYLRRLIYAVPRIAQGMPFAEGTTPGFYADVNGQTASASARMARESLEQDMAQLAQFFDANLLLLTLSRYVRLQGMGGAEPFQVASGIEGLQQLVSLRGDGGLRAMATAEFGRLLYSLDDSDEQEEMMALWRESLKQTDEIGAMVAILGAPQRTKAMEGYGKFVRHAGGVMRSDGIIGGDPARRPSWRYVLSTDLLWVLVQLAAVLPDRGAVDASAPRTLRLSEFVSWLSDRYALDLSEPPGEASVVRRAAAQANVDALRERLRQMGMMDPLSDDFETQQIRPAFLDAAQEEAGHGY